MEKIVLIPFVLFSFFTADPDVPAEKWNFREKDRLLEHVREGETYRGLFYHRYQWIMHELIPQDDGSFLYNKVGDYPMSSCIYQGGDAEQIVAEIMASYQPEAPPCEPYEQTINPDEDENEYESISTQGFKLLGHRDGRMVGMIGHYGDQEYYSLVYLNEKGIGEPVNDVKYGTDNVPVAVSEESVILYRGEPDQVVLQRKDKEIPIPDEVSFFFKMVAQSNRNPMPYLVGDGVVYTPTSQNEKPGPMVKLYLETGEYEPVAEAAVTPRISEKHLYYFQVPESNREDDLDEAGLIRKRINKRKTETLMNGFVARGLDFQPMSYIPLASGNLMYQVGGSFGSSTRTVELEMTKIAEFSALLERMMQARQTLRDYRDQHPNAIREKNSDAAEAAEVAVAEEAAVAAEVAEEAVAEEAAVATEVAEEAVAEMEVAEERMEEEASAYEEEEVQRYEDPRLTELYEQREALEEQGEQMMASMLKLVFLPENYQLYPHPITNEPVFIPKNPFWPILYMEDALIFSADELR